jgi:hypothetical protein
VCRDARPASEKEPRLRTLFRATQPRLDSSHTSCHYSAGEVKSRENLGHTFAAGWVTEHDGEISASVARGHTRADIGGLGGLRDEGETEGDYGGNDEDSCE